MFKRLYWQCYTGRFVAFDWPTQWVNTDNTGWSHPIGNASFLGHQSSRQNFDQSEQIAWNSATSLYNLLVTLDGRYGSQNVNIIAHSMGNDVTSEALRIAAAQPTPVPVVNAYIASQAATSADAYDPTVALGTDIFSTFLGSDGSYFANLNVVAPQMFNFYNPDDIAVGTGATDRWNLNNSLKPDTGYAHQYTSRFGSTSLNYVRKSTDTVLSYATASTRYEAFAFAVQSASGALGGTANVGGPFTKLGQVDLNTQFKFGSDHSGQFDGTEQWRKTYWLKVMTDFGLPYWPQ